jgi:hypothetical protein
VRVVGGDDCHGSGEFTDAVDDGGQDVGEFGAARSRSVSVLDGAICNSGIRSVLVGGVYWTRLW